MSLYRVSRWIFGLLGVLGIVNTPVASADYVCGEVMNPRLQTMHNKAEDYGVKSADAMMEMFESKTCRKEAHREAKYFAKYKLISEAKQAQMIKRVIARKKLNRDFYTSLSNLLESKPKQADLDEFAKTYSTSPVDRLEDLHKHPGFMKRVGAEKVFENVSVHQYRDEAVIVYQNYILDETLSDYAECEKFYGKSKPWNLGYCVSEALVAGPRLSISLEEKQLDGQTVYQPEGGGFNYEQAIHDADLKVGFYEDQQSFKDFHLNSMADHVLKELPVSCALEYIHSTGEGLGHLGFPGTEDESKGFVYNLNLDINDFGAFVVTEPKFEVNWDTSPLNEAR